jgi:hypothetical protein
MVLTVMNQWINYMLGDARSPLAKTSNELGSMIARIREGRSELEDPEDIVLFDKAVDVLSGLKEAFDARERDQAAWR